MNNTLVNILTLTILEHSLHVQTIGCTCFIVRTPLEIIGQLPSSGVLDYTRMTLVDCI